MRSEVKTRTARCFQAPPQFANDLTQHRPRPLLAQLAPKQSDQPLSIHAEQLPERNISENGAGLQASKGDVLLANSQ